MVREKTLDMFFSKIKDDQSRFNPISFKDKIQLRHKLDFVRTSIHNLYSSSKTDISAGLFHELLIRNAVQLISLASAIEEDVLKEAEINNKCFLYTWTYRKEHTVTATQDTIKVASSAEHPLRDLPYVEIFNTRADALAFILSKNQSNDFVYYFEIRKYTNNELIEKHGERIL